MDQEPAHCCFDDWASRNASRARRKETVAGVTAPLLAGLEAAGLRGRSILDVGCGVGDLALAALAHGAALATGMDLGAGAIAQARLLAEDRGLGDRAVFMVGDGAEAPLPRSDVVVLNRVICCYPDARGLLENTLGAAAGVYGFSVPASRGLAGGLVRLETRFANAWYRLRRAKYAGFRVFVHDVEEIDRRVREAGFAPVRRQRHRLVWDLAVYTREGA